MTAEPAPSPKILLEQRGAVLTIRFSNPRRANALTAGMLDGLVDALERRTGDARAVLIGGAGDRHFSAGLDLADGGAEDSVVAIEAGERRLGRAAAAIEDCPRPVIGVVNGAAFGGALELAMACDWRIAARGAQLGMPAARIGVVYAADGLSRFIAAMGPARTRRLFLTGRAVDADEAYALGMVDHVVEGEQLWSVATDAGADVAAAAPLGVAGTRAIVRALSVGSPDVGPRVADRWGQRSFASHDLREGLAAFRDKRPPEFTES